MSGLQNVGYLFFVKGKRERLPALASQGEQMQTPTHIEPQAYVS